MLAIPDPPLLQVEAVRASYGQFQALFGVDLTVGAGEIVSVIGANGAGKSTLMKAIVGRIARMRGDVRLEGRSLCGLDTRAIIEAGIAHVPEGRRLFSALTVEENLKVGERLGRGRGMALPEIYATFPVLRDKRRLKACELSGGQQQMVAIGRALLCAPKVLLCDEISIGLAPAIIEQLYEILPRIADRGIGIVLVEQDLTRSLAVSQRFYCVLRGKVSLAGRSSEFSRDSIVPHYLGQ